ncbi:MAG: DUF4442 domain-containing protein [Betaproteobacteria bacterium]|nr:DUF4442 domain-containing protein [Betaproteobacteria bacterium]
MNCWPPFLGAGIRVRRIAADFSEVDVEMRLAWYNRNYVRTHFGGSLYAMTDPFHMIMTMHLLGPGYIVWDKAGSVDYVAPGRGTVRALFRIGAAQIDDIRRRAAGGERVFPEFAVDVVDDAGGVVARVRKTLYVRLKKPAIADAGGASSAE